MPSGAKKRKAAKKKKGNNHFNNSSSTSTSTLGDDLKHQDFKKDNTIVIEDDSVIKVERGFKNEDESIGGNTSSNGSSSSSGSSSSNSSDDESNGNDKSQTTVDNPPVVDSVSETLPEDIHVATVKEDVHVATVKEAPVSVKETPVSEEISSFDEEPIVEVISPTDNPVASYEVDFVSNENEKKLSNVVEDKVGISAVSSDFGSDTREEGTNIQSVENSVAVLVPEKCLEPENDDKLTLSHNDAPNVTVEHEKDSGVTEPLLAPAQREVQTTSWKSCCGLFELFTGSGR